MRIGCCQIEPKVGHRRENVEKTILFAEEAAEGGADIILLPELANTGYIFETRSEAFELSEEVPKGETVQAWEAFARKLKAYSWLASPSARKVGCTTHRC